MIADLRTWCFSPFIFLFETGPYSVAQATLEFVAVFSPQPPECRANTQTEGNQEFEVLVCSHDPGLYLHHCFSTLTGCICVKCGVFLIQVGGNLLCRT